MEEVKSEDDTVDLLTQRKETLAEGITAHSLFSPTLLEFDDNSKSPKPYYFNDDTLTTNDAVPQLNSRDLFGSFGSSEGESSSSESELDEDKNGVVCSNKSRDNSPSDAVSPIAFIYEDTPLLSTEVINEMTPHKKLESPKNRRDDILKMKLAHVKETPAKSSAAEDTKETVVKKRDEPKHKNGVKKKKKFELSNFVKKAETSTEEVTSEDTDTTTTLSEPSINTEPSVALVESKLTPSPSVKVTETLNTLEVPPIATKTTKHEKINTTVAVSSTTNQKKKRNWRLSGSESESASSSSDDEILVSAAKKTKVDKFDSDNEEQSDKEFINKTELHSHRHTTTTGNISNTDTKSIKSDRSSSNNASKVLSTVTKKSDDRNSSNSKKLTNDKPKIREFDFCSTLTQSQQKYSSTKLSGKKNSSTRDQRLLKAIVNGKKPGSVKATGATNILKVSSPMKSLSQSLKRPGPPKPKTAESLSNNNLTSHSSPDEAKHKQTPAVADEAEKPASSEKDSVLAAKFPLKRRALQNPVLKI